MPRQGPCRCARLRFVPDGGCWSHTGCKGMDGLHSRSSALGHQQGEGKKVTLRGILLYVIHFWGFFFFGVTPGCMAGGSGSFHLLSWALTNMPSSFAWGLPTFFPSCPATVGGVECLSSAAAASSKGYAEARRLLALLVRLLGGVSVEYLHVG